ncbi:MAG: alcohol dehydrogenase catalytic domain-containing protein [Rhizobiaceae bacterium]
MMADKMFGLVCRHDGFSGNMEGPHIDSLDPWLEGAELTVPEPGDGEALVKVTMASVNPSDLHFIKGEYGLPRRAGVPAGFEAVGEVVKAGKGGEALVGKRVGFFASGSGAWADYAIANVRACIPVLDAVRDEDAAALLVNPMTAVAMYEEAISDGNECFIMTAAASQLCKLIAGLAKEESKGVISIVRRDEQIEPLKSYGSTYVLNCKSGSFKKDIKALITDKKPRVMLDAVADQTASDIFAAMPRNARWIIYGKLSSESPVLTQPGQFIFMNKRVEGFWLSQWMKDKPVDEQIKAGMKVQQMFATGKWKTDVAEVISLRDAHARLPDALSGAINGKVLLAP